MTRLPCSHELLAVRLDEWGDARPVVESAAPAAARVRVTAPLPGGGRGEGELAVVVARGLTGGPKRGAATLAAACEGCRAWARVLRSWPERRLRFLCSDCLPFRRASVVHGRPEADRLLRAVRESDVATLRAHRRKVAQGSRWAAVTWLEAWERFRHDVSSHGRGEGPVPLGTCRQRIGGEAG